MAYILPSFGAQYDDEDSAYQSAPLLNKYSPRLFGSPPQLTHLCDMRTQSTDYENKHLGAVGDFYLNDILKNAQVANIIVGRARFTGGYNSIWNSIVMIRQYAEALSRYNIYSPNGSPAKGSDADAAVARAREIDNYNNMTNIDELENISIADVMSGANLGLSENGEATDEQLQQAQALDQANSEFTSYIESLADSAVGADNDIQAVMGTLIGIFKESFSVQQPFYTFESDWYTYINNVKMMINSAIIMLGLQDACVRIGDTYYPIGMNTKEHMDSDVWSNYRFITPDEDSGVSVVSSINNLRGDTNQYVTFMCNPVSENETYTNSITDSQIYSSVINQGIGIGNEIAFITNSSQTTVTDAVINIASGAVNTAEKVVSALGGGVGRFTAAIAGSMARSFVGDHTIYPKIFQSHESHGGMTLQIKLRASRGDPYTYLTDILVPMFFLLAMAIPKMSQNSSAAYCFPPLIQCSIPGIWGTRLGMVESLDIQKNPDGNDVSVNGYPLAVNVSLRIVDLYHCMVSSPMNQPALFLNNHTMFDYIAQCCGVDKYRVNGSIRMVTKIALAASFTKNAVMHIGSGVLNDFTSFVNKYTRLDQI
jgi:hypothetical protein